MSKKIPSNRPTANFGRIAVDPAIESKLEHAAKIAKALKLNKEFRTKRTQKKRWRGHVEQNARDKNPFIHAPQSIGLLPMKQLLPEEIPEWQSEIPSNTVKAGFNQWSYGWHREARTGEIGKRPTKPPADDPRYSTHPYRPKQE